MTQKFTVVLMHKTDGPLTFHVWDQSPKEAAEKVVSGLAEDTIGLVAGVFVGWHINKFFGEV